MERKWEGDYICLTRLCGFARRGAAEAVMISQISLEGVQYVRLGLWNYERAF